MNTLSNQRSWLLDRDLLKLVHQCRRLIHTEFGVRLHLTEEHLEQRIAEYAARSRSGQLRHTWETLRSRVPELNTETEHASGTAKRIYRGQVIEETEVKKGREPEDRGPEEAPRRKKKVIYRGHEVG